MLKRVVLVLLIIWNTGITASDGASHSAGLESISTREFARVSLSARRQVDAVRLMEADSDDPGRIAIIDKGVVSVGTDHDVGGYSPVDEAPELRPLPFDVNVRIRMGTGEINRRISVPGHVGSVKASTEKSELQVKYVALGSVRDNGVDIAFCWRFFSSGQISDSGTAVMRLQPSNPVQTVLKGDLSRRPSVDAAIQVGVLE